jgi:glycosyltransferase involved in cell wall biosynthesis
LVKELVATGALAEDSFLVRPLTTFENWVERRVDCIVAQSQLRRDEFIAKGIPADKIIVVEDVPELDTLHLEESQLDRNLERRLRPRGEKLLIYAGGMETYQGVDFLLAAFRELCLQRSDVRLVLFGRPLAEYRVMAEQLEIAEKIVFVDDEPFDRLPQYLNICDVGLALRLYGENVPGKLPIYMASGIAVVGTDIKGINSVLVDHETGLLVPPGDVPALVERLSWLLDHGETARVLGAAGRQEALRRYSPADQRRELGKCYRKLLERQRQ